MKKFFNKFTSLFLVLVTLFNTVVSPLTVLADVNQKGDLRLVTESGTETGDSVTVTEGSLTNPGDIQITKTVSKTDTLGRYKVQFTVKGKDVVNQSSTTKDVYVVVVLDKSGSMSGNKWTNAVTGAKTFATTLLSKISNAKIALVTFSGNDDDEETCERVWVDDGFWGGHYETQCSVTDPNNDATIVRGFENKNLNSINFGNANGGTNLGEGLNKAIDLFNNQDIPNDAFKYVVVLGDGEPTFYTDGDGKTAGPGGQMTSDTKKYAYDKASALKTSGVEIFSIGYSVTANSAAETVLKNVASTEKDTDKINHYVSSNPTAVANAFTNIAISISTDFAGKNATLNDGIGSQFTLVSGSNNIIVGNITEEGFTSDPFYIDIDPDSPTGWHQTNANFTLSYTKPDGTTGTITSTKNPEVYWIQPEYDYRVEYYYNGTIDNSLTETGTAYKDEKVSVTDTTINDSKHLKNGYKFSSVTPSKEITIKNNGENVIRIYYVKDNYEYTVNYFYNGVKDTTATEVKSAEFESEISTYTDKVKTGYKFEKVETTDSDKVMPLTISYDTTKNIINVYYVTDEKQTKELKYTVEYYKNGVLQENDTQVETKTVQVLEPDTLNVDKTKINTTDKYYGYKLEKTVPTTIPDTIENNGVIKVYYVIDQDNQKELKYTVEYYKDGVLQTKDTQTVTEKVQVLEDNTLTVKKEDINTDNKYDGYKFVGTNPTVIPDTINNNGVVKVYYEKDTFGYTVEYYYDGVIDNSKTESKTALFEETISTYTDKKITGYKLEKTENLPLVITSDATKNVIKVYYVKDNYGYKVEYYYDGVLDDSKTYTNSAVFGSKVETYPDKVIKGYSLEKTENFPLTITENTQINLIKVYYVSNSYDYTIKHVEKGNETNILATESNSAKFGSTINVVAKEFTGFTYDSKDKDTIVIDTENNTATVYYTRNSYNYTIKHVEKGNETNVLGTDTGSANYQDTINVVAKEFTGFTYDSKDKEKIVIDTENNTATVYYTRNSYNYTVNYFYNGVKDTAATEVKSAEFESEITTYTDKVKTGYKFEKVETTDSDKVMPLTISYDTTKNIINVYYVTDENQTKELKYTVEYYKNGVLQENDTQVETKTVQVLEPDTLNVDKTKINTTDKYYGYKFEKTIPTTIPTTIENNGVIKVYYVIDQDNQKELKYTVEYYKDGVLQTKDTQTVTEKVQVLEENTLTVKKGDINTVNKYDGYKFVGTNPSVIPDTINNNGVIKVYYEKDTFGYTVEYYYDGVIDNSKTENKTALFEETISTYTDKKITGYKLEKTENFPLVITSDSTKNVIKVYYVKDNYGYKVEYYYDGVLDDSKTYTSSAEFGSKVETYLDKVIKGYSFEKTENFPLTITENTQSNLIKVYYVSNSYDYTIKHVEKGNETNILATESNSAKFGSTINVVAKEFTGFTYDSKDKDTIVIDTENNTATVYYTRNSYNYTIKHVELGNETNVLGTDTGSANYQDTINVVEKEFTGFTYDSKDKDTIVIDTENNTATVYYTRNSYNYTIKHVEKGNETNVLGTDTGSANYQDTINVVAKEFKGFTYDSKDKDAIVIDTDNNTATVYYTRNSYNYTIKHVELGNETNVLGTDTGSANYQDTINVVEKEFTGFTYDSKDKDTIVIDTENNTATVYYTRNSYDYTIKHVELGNETNVLEIETGSANYQDEIAVKEKEFTGFTYDSKDKEIIVIDTNEEITDDGIVISNIATVYYTRNLYNYSVEYYLENLDGDFDLQETEIIKGVPFESAIEYVVKEYDNYVYDEDKTEAPEVVVEDNMVVRLYYLLGDSNVEVHYVIKVEDNYIPFDKYGRDEFGNPTEDFADVELEDVTLTGKIGTEFTTKYREVKDYTFVGLYEGNIINNSEIAKLEGTTITDKFDFETKEYTYVYEAPKGGDELPPQTGFDGNISYINYILLIAVVYILKKYFELISTK